MKRTLLSFLLSIGITAPFLSVPLAAQQISETAKVPFAFRVNGTHMPAGEYRVSSVTPSGASFAVRNAQGSPTAFVQMGVLETAKSEQPSLKFACYGKQCVLAAINPGDGLAAYRLPTSVIEKNLSHRLSMASMISVGLGRR